MGFVVLKKGKKYIFNILPIVCGHVIVNLICDNIVSIVIF